MMTTFRCTSFLAACVLALACCSCQPPPVVKVTSQRAPSLVVDLDAVAKALGWDVVIAQRVEAATQNLNSQLIQAAESMEKEYQQQLASAGSSPTPEQVAALQRTKLRVQQNVQNNKLVAEQARDKVRAQQILLFRQEIKPVAGRIAADRGSEVVLIANEDVVWFSPEADITGDVISALRARQSVLPESKPGPESPATETNSVTAPTNAPTTTE